MLCFIDNPVQETNRDISIAMIKLFQELRAEDHAAVGAKVTRMIVVHSSLVAKATAKGKTPPTLPGISILEALSASGSFDASSACAYTVKVFARSVIGTRSLDLTKS